MTFKLLLGGLIPPFFIPKKLIYELHNSGQRSLLDYIQNLWS